MIDPASTLPAPARPVILPPASIPATARRVLAILAAAQIAALACVGVASAQTSSATQAQCDNIGGLPQGTQVQVSQANARAVVDIIRPGGAGRKAEVEYGDELYSQKAGPDGRVRIAFALTAPSSQFTIALAELPPITCAITVPNFNRLYRVVLRWRDPVQLDLNVLEPGGRAGEAGHVSGARPNPVPTQAIGQMDLVGATPVDGATAEISYAVANPASIPANGMFSYRVEYVTRGAQPDAPYCDEFALAAPPFEFITIENGTVSTRRMTMNRARCREKLADARRLMPVRP